MGTEGMLEALSVDGNDDVALGTKDEFGVGEGFPVGVCVEVGVDPTEHEVPPHCAQSCDNATFDDRPSVELCT